MALDQNLIVQCENLRAPQAWINGRPRGASLRVSAYQAFCLDQFCLLWQLVITVITKNCRYEATGAAMEKALRTRDIKIVHIGNSLGVRLPKNLLQKYGFTDSLVLEETAQGILLRKKQDDKLSLADTYKAMACDGEEWNEYDQTLLDGIDDGDFDT